MTTLRPRPTPPRPDLVRTPDGPYGWLDARLLHQGWLSRLGAEGTAVLTLLAVAADRQGASFYGREKMAQLLSMTRADLDRALHRLLEVGLVVHRPWSSGHSDGVWQLLPVPPRNVPRSTTSQPTSIGDILTNLFGDGP